jgi:hypothetical protein
MFQVITETRIQSEHSVRSKDMENKRYSKVLLNCWDHSQTGPQMVRDQRFAIAQSLRIILDEAKRQESIKLRKQGENTLLMIRKVVGNLIVILLIAMTAGIIIVIRQFEDDITSNFNTLVKTDSWPEWMSIITNNTASVMISIVITVLNYITPTIARIITNFEKWDKPTTALKIVVFRYYLLRIITIIILLIQFAQMMGTIKSRNTSSDDLICGIDDVGNQMFFLILTTLVSELIEPALMIGKFGIQWLKCKYKTYRLKKQIRHSPTAHTETDDKMDTMSSVNGDVETSGSERRLSEIQPFDDLEQNKPSALEEEEEPVTEARLEKEEFKTAPRLMSLIYLQTIMWLTLMFLPIGIVVVGLISLFLFKYEKFFVMLLLRKPKRPVDARTQSGFFSILYCVTFLIIAASYYYVLNIYTVNVTYCGPLTANTTLIDTLREDLDETKAGPALLFMFTHILTNSALIWLMVAGLVILYFWKSYSTTTMATYISVLTLRLYGEQRVYEEKLTAQQTENDNLKRQLAVHRQSEGLEKEKMA